MAEFPSQNTLTKGTSIECASNSPQSECPCFMRTSLYVMELLSCGLHQLLALSQRFESEESGDDSTYGSDM
jgi:hypothetical protein